MTGSPAGRAHVHPQGQDTHHGGRGVLFRPPPGREPAGGRQGPPEDAAEPRASLSRRAGRLAAPVPARGRTRRRPGDARFPAAPDGARDGGAADREAPSGAPGAASGDAGPGDGRYPLPPERRRPVDRHRARGAGALKLPDLPDQPRALGLNGRRRGRAPANIIGRMARPGSERATNAWPRAASATGEPLGIDFGALSDMALYRASDHPLTHRTALEDHMFGTSGRSSARGRSLRFMT